MKFLTHLEEYFIAFLLTMMTIMTAVNAFFRYVLQASLSWVFELNTFMFAGVIFLGMAWGVRVSAHIGIDFVVQKLPNKQQRSKARLIFGWLCPATPSKCIILSPSTLLRKLRERLPSDFMSRSLVQRHFFVGSFA